LLKISAQPNLDTPLEDASTTSSSISSTVIVTDPQPVSESIHIQTSLDAQPSDPALSSIPSGPASTGSMPSLIETEGDFSEGANPSVSLGEFQDSRPSQPSDEPETSSDSMPRCQSLPNLPLSCACFPQRAASLDPGTPVPTSTAPSQIDTVVSQTLSSPRAPQVEISSVIETAVTASPQSPTRDPLSGEVLDTRQQEPPFMTDGRGRVVWSRSGAKHGNLSPETRIQDRTPNTAGDRD
jgi:hypothetical protein